MFCALLRGKPGAGKSTLLKALAVDNTCKLDADSINTISSDYRNFQPNSIRNPSEKVKRYCFLFHKAREGLNKKKNVIWAQPWSRVTEIETTIRNFAFYFLDYKEKSWTSELVEIIEKLPFEMLVIELQIENALSEKRVKQRYAEKIWEKVEQPKLKRFNMYYQNITYPLPKFQASGKTKLEAIRVKTTNFLDPFK